MALPGVSVFRQAPFCGVTPCAEPFHQEHVQPLDVIVALLVVAVDGPLDLGNAHVGDVLAAGDIFFVPQQVIEAMLLAHDLHEAVIRIANFLLVPESHRARVEIQDVLYPKHAHSLLLKGAKSVEASPLPSGCRAMRRMANKWGALSRPRL